MLGKVESENLLNSIKSQKLSKRTTFTEETLNMAIEIRKTSENKKVFMGSLYFTGNNARDRELQIFIDKKEGTFEFIAWQEKTLLNYQGHPYVWNKGKCDQIAALSKETRYDLFMESIPNIVSYLIQQAIIHGKISLEEINLPPCSFDYSHGAEEKVNLLTEIILKCKIIQADIRKNEIDIITDNNTKELFSLVDAFNQTLLKLEEK